MADHLTLDIQRQGWYAVGLASVPLRRAYISLALISGVVPDGSIPCARTLPAPADSGPGTPNSGGTSSILVAGARRLACRAQTDLESLAGCEPDGSSPLAAAKERTLQDTLELTDIEQSLENDIAHFRTTHRECVPKILPGTILESNCGELYRTNGSRVHPIDRAYRCYDCYRKSGLRLCPVCNIMDFPEGIF